MRNLWDYGPPLVDRIWGIRGSYYDIPKAIFYLLKGDYKLGLVILLPPGSHRHSESFGGGGGGGGAKCTLNSPEGQGKIYFTHTQRVQVPKNWVLGFWVIVIIVQVLGKYMIIRYLDH